MTKKNKAFESYADLWTCKALEMVEDISANAQSLNPKRDWKESHNAVCKVYEIVHSIRSPGCRKNHPKWSAQVDRALAEEAR